MSDSPSRTHDERWIDPVALRRAASFEPIWLAGGRFVASRWAREGGSIVRVDPEAGTATELVRLPGEIADLEVAGPELLRFSSGGTLFELDLSAPGSAPRACSPERTAALARRAPRRLDDFPVANAYPITEIPSPSGERLLAARDGGLWLRAADSEEARRLTGDEPERVEWSDGRWCWPLSTWSRDGATVAAWRIDARATYHLPIVDWLGERDEVTYHVYPRSGDPLPEIELVFIDAGTGAQTVAERGGYSAHFQPVGWHPNGRDFLHAALSRDARTFEIRASDRETGRTRVLFSDRSDTVVMSVVRFLFRFDPSVALLADGRFLVSSERSGWRHLYLGGGDGELAPVTDGERSVRDIAGIDESRGLVYAVVHDDAGRPYDRHLVVFPLAGGPGRRLTEEPGDHDVRISPTGDHYVDTHSAIDRAPRTEVRRADGGLLVVVPRPGLAAAVGSGYAPPEEFEATAADGVTPVHGVLYTPRDFDPAGRYPVVEYIYGGEHSLTAPRSFVEANGNVAWQKLRDLGFVVVALDARGTPGRIKAFHDVVHGGIGRHEIPDHAAAIRELARTRPYLDLTRVGITGGSYGGYFTVRAMLQAPDLYHVAVALCPAVEMTTIMTYISENTLGGTHLEVPDRYRAADTTLLVEALTGKLLLLHGTTDVNAPLGQTMRLVAALTAAGKDYDLRLFPGADHAFRTGDGGSVMGEVDRLTLEYLVEHLKPGE